MAVPNAVFKKDRVDRAAPRATRLYTTKHYHQEELSVLLGQSSPASHSNVPCDRGLLFFLLARALGVQICFGAYSLDTCASMC